MIGCETPRQAENGSYDRDGLICLEDGNSLLFANCEQLDIDLVYIGVGQLVDQAGKKKVKLNRWLKRRLQRDFHDSCS